MAMTASLTTPDGAEHPQAFAKVYPITLQILPGDEIASLTVRCWHSQAAFESGLPELSGYPTEIRFVGQAAQQKTMQAIAAMRAVPTTGDIAIDGPATTEAVIAALEDIVIAERPEFARVV